MTDRYAVIGNPIAHSKSPEIHAQFAAQTRQDISYERILAPLDGFREAVLRFREEGGKGLNVTLPFKTQAFELATKHADRAHAARAVNTLRFDYDEIAGDNTDGAGLVNDLERNLKFPVARKRVLVVGAGGAAQGVVYPLLKAGAESLVLANRTKDKALAFVRTLFSGMRSLYQLTACGLDELAGQRFDLVVNATSSGLQAEAPQLPDALFNEGALAYDMVYGVGETPFLSYARSQGAAVSDGLGMLVEQAAESFFLWRGLRPNTASVLEQLRRA